MNKTGRMLAAAIAAAALFCPTLQAQTESFSDFRSRIMSDFKEFRSSVLENYDKFLEGAWEDFDQIKGEKSSSVPKPRKAPCVEPTSAPTIATSPEPTPAPKPKPKPKPKPTPDPVIAKKPTPIPTVPKSEKPTQTEPKPTPTETDRFTVADIPFEVAHINFNISNRLKNNQEYGAHWRGLVKTGLADRLIPEFRDMADRLGLNDYLTYLAVDAWANSRFPQAHSSSRKSLVHYMLTNMGYDVRLGTNRNGDALLLIPFKQMVYARPYLNIGGRKFFIFADDGVDLANPENLRISTCALPSDADTGNPLDLVLSELKLPSKPYHYNIHFGDIAIEGEMNGALMPLLYHYPQMPTADYARSSVLPDVRRHIVAQFKEQLAGMDEQTAVNKLLQFVQKGFEYATDEDFHGFEKPYFLEETLFYPKNDCEDRAIFYTYMLWEVLGIPNQLICYPGHESASVSLKTQVKGSSYTNDGRTFYISDPTYIGSVTGQCMPSYEHTAPEIDYTYQ